jgi:hypothetical protein
MDRLAAPRTRRSLTCHRPRFCVVPLRSSRPHCQEVEDRTCLHTASGIPRPASSGLSPFVDTCGGRSHTPESAWVVTPSLIRRRSNLTKRTTGSPPLEVQRARLYGRSKGAGIRKPLFVAGVRRNRRKDNALRRIAPCTDGGDKAQPAATPRLRRLNGAPKIQAAHTCDSMIARCRPAQEFFNKIRQNTPFKLADGERDHRHGSVNRCYRRPFNIAFNIS